MKKVISAVASAALAAALLVGCGSDAAESAPASSADASSAPASSAVESAPAESAAASEEAVALDAAYHVTNTTGETVTELYLYEADSEDKGENFASEGLAADETVVIECVAETAEEAENTTYVLEFTTESGATQKYETVGFEVVAINLLSVDAAAGATPVQFGPVA